MREHAMVLCNMARHSIEKEIIHTYYLQSLMVLREGVNVAEETFRDTLTLTSLQEVGVGAKSRITLNCLLFWIGMWFNDNMIIFYEKFKISINRICIFEILPSLDIGPYKLLLMLLHYLQKLFRQTIKELLGTFYLQYQTNFFSNFSCFDLL